ncbi:M23 family metallopeptidase [Halodesulfovibrio marinisediminis]|uniref:Murein DD-endopeptidase MepM and murein hydrolase activator NlpD, contain LysM domain n=1 Tax=Halodesulfovibrio marinisediminis DSM 17456 TaxID=1121457 RepID=A0A1N6IXF6_9BACT|nr:peptidoglycan DD-metalloendopeptidase family protein [Halodesulfovibrio marinisediminis]SIO36734.1 Murein DD-endopeptidase MepM and murein hydrolase activator NlpD, contain LysM domain [Halodesulfovibrio marinisediminis DSM 17456]
MKSYFLTKQKKDYLFFTVALLLFTSLLALPNLANASATSTASITKRYDLSYLLNGLEQGNPKKPLPTEQLPDFANEQLITKKVTVKRGDTLYGVLKKAGVPLKQQRQIVATTLKQKAFRFDVGETITLSLRKIPKTKRKELVQLSVQLNKTKRFAVRLQPNGTYKAGVERTQYKGKLQYVVGVIKNSFVKDAQHFGLPASLAKQAEKLLAKRKKLTRKTIANKDFEVIYEVYPKASGIAPRIQYVRLGKTPALQLYYFEGESGGSYYDANGNTTVSKGKIEPVKNARLSSKFGYRRHPVLKRRLMHKGVDYAARRGTPIYAVADGTIDFIGRKGGFGNHISLRHDKSTQTTYSHMRKFKKGLKRGSKVKAGDIIGYVGNTGRSTGPHLHFEVRKNGKAVNPLTAQLPRPSKLEGVELAQFKLSQVRLFLQVAQQRVMTETLASLTPEALAKAAL